MRAVSEPNAAKMSLFSMIAPVQQLLVALAACGGPKKPVRSAPNGVTIDLRHPPSQSRLSSGGISRKGNTSQGQNVIWMASLTPSSRLWKHDIGRLDGDVCHGTDCDTDVGLGECRGVVDSVTY